MALVAVIHNTELCGSGTCCGGTTSLLAKSLWECPFTVALLRLPTRSATSLGVVSVLPAIKGKPHTQPMYRELHGLGHQPR